MAAASSVVRSLPTFKEAVKSHQSFGVGLAKTATTFSVADKTAKGLIGGFDIARAALTRCGQTSQAGDLAKGSAVLSAFRGVVKPWDFLESIGNAIKACQDKDAHAAWCSFMSIGTDGLDTIQALNKMGAFHLPEPVSTRLGWLGNLISMAGLPALVGLFSKKAHKEFQAANDYEKKRAFLLKTLGDLGVPEKVAKKTYEARKLEYNMHVARDKGVSLTLNAVEKSFIVAAVVLSIIATVFFVLGMGLPSLALACAFGALAMAAAAVGIGRICRDHFNKHNEPKAEDYLSPAHVDVATLANNAAKIADRNDHARPWEAASETTLAALAAEIHVRTHAGHDKNASVLGSDAAAIAVALREAEVQVAATEDEHQEAIHQRAELLDQIYGEDVLEAQHQQAQLAAPAGVQPIAGPAADEALVGGAPVAEQVAAPQQPPAVDEAEDLFA